ncbi:MAG: GNAT family N-acetyltransferase [Dongiaceae bacterium]
MTCRARRIEGALRDRVVRLRPRRATGEPPALRLRRAVPADAEAVRALTRAAYAKWCAVIGREPLPMGADQERAIREHRVDLAFLGEALAGLVETVARRHDLLIESLAVDPAWQGRGLGERLLRHAEAVAGELGLGVVRLYTNALFASNLAFYRARGYSVEREEPFRGGTIVHLMRRLNQPG